MQMDFPDGYMLSHVFYIMYADTPINTIPSFYAESRKLYVTVYISSAIFEKFKALWSPIHLRYVNKPQKCINMCLLFSSVSLFYSETLLY